MHKRTQARASSLMLLELLLAILLFSVTAAICVQIFSKANLLGQESVALNRSVNHSSAIAEIVQVSDNRDAAVNAISAEYDKAAVSSKDGKTVITVYFDKSSNLCDKKDASYKLTASLYTEGGMLYADIEADKYYKLSVKHYTGEA